VRVTRSARRKKMLKKRRRLIAGMTGILSMATVGVAQMPTPTYGLIANQTAVGLPQDHSAFKAAFVFPQMVQELAERAEEAAKKASDQLKKATEMLEESPEEPCVTEDVYVVPHIEPSVTDLVYQLPIDSGERPFEVEKSLAGLLETIHHELEVKSNQSLELQSYVISAHQYEEEAWAIVSQLSSYKNRALEEAERVLLYIEPALLQAEQAAREATMIVSQLELLVRQLDDQVSQMESQVEHLMEELQETGSDKTETPSVEPAPETIPDPDTKDGHQQPDDSQEELNPDGSDPFKSDITDPLHADPILFSEPVQIPELPVEIETPEQEVPAEEDHLTVQPERTEQQLPHVSEAEASSHSGVRPVTTIRLKPQE